MYFKTTLHFHLLSHFSLEITLPVAYLVMPIFCIFIQVVSRNSHSNPQTTNITHTTYLAYIGTVDRLNNVIRLKWFFTTYESEMKSDQLTFQELNTFPNGPSRLYSRRAGSPEDVEVVS